MSNKHRVENGDTGVKTEELAVSDFVIDTQFRLHQLVKASGMSQADLAEKLGMSKSRVSAIFGCDSNLTLRTVGKVLYALGEAGARLRSPTIDARMGVLSGCKPESTVASTSVADVQVAAMHFRSDSVRAHYFKSLISGPGRKYMERTKSVAIGDAWCVTNDNLCDDGSKDLKVMGH